LAVLGFLTGTVYVLLGGPPWPVDPEIHPTNTTVDSSLILPFSVTNKSGLVWMNDVQMTCGVDLVYGMEADGEIFIIRDNAFITGRYSIKPMGSIPYRCNASALLQMRENGTLSLYGSSSELMTQGGEPIIWHSPFNIIKTRIWVGGVYKVFGLIPWSFKSEIDQWPASPVVRQWIEGPVTPPFPGQNPFAGLPEPFRIFSVGTPVYDAQHRLLPSATECNASVKYPFALTTGPGREVLVFERPPWFLWLWRKALQVMHVTKM
jgi:hypothetical protein